MLDLLKLADYREGLVRLVNFYASECNVVISDEHSE